jgi:RNA polymerase sigma-70 factor (ECF subfamily)
MTTLEQLFLRFRSARDPAALGELFDRTSQQLLSLALHLCGNPADAEDALQATFVAAIDRAATWDASRPLGPWLGGILTLQCKKLGERRVRRREAELPEPGIQLDEGSPVDANERRELVGRLREHIDRLPPEQRQVLLLQLEHGLSPAEVGEVLGVPPGTVRMRLHRAVKALRGLMPAGLVALLLAALPTRGLAAVRAAVLAAVAAGGPWFAGKHVAGLVAAALVVFAAGWAVLEPIVVDAVAPTSATGTSAAGGVGRLTMAPSVSGAEEHRTGVEVSRSPAPTVAASSVGSLRIRLLYAVSGQPVPNVPFRVVPDRSDVEPRLEFTAAVTGADGVCTVDALAPGRVRAESIGGLAEAAEVRAGEQSTLELEIDPTQAPLCRARGCVVHADGRPAAGATIVVASQGRLHCQPIGFADAQGRFDVPIVGRFQLVGARLAGFAPSTSRTFDGNADVELVLPGPGAAIVGTVVDTVGAPVANTCVEVGEPRLDRQWQDPRGWLVEAPSAQHLRTDAAGRFVASDVPAGEIGVFVAAAGCAPFHRYVQTKPGESLELRCELATGCDLRGRVVDQAGAPVAGANVTLGDVHRRTDSDGRFGVRHAPPGPLWLRIEGEGIVATTCERAAGVEGEWSCTVARQRQFRLRFVDECAVPLVGWNVELRAVGARMVTTDAAGRANVFEGTGPGSLWLSPPGAIHAVMPWPWPPGLLPEVETTIVVPTLSQPTAALAGELRGPDGGSLARAVVELRSPEGSFLYRQHGVSGRFRFDRVPAGDWVVEVHRQGRGSAGGRFEAPAVRAGEVRDLGVLQMPREGLVQFHVVLADGRVPRDAAVFLFDAEGREHHAPPRDGTAHPWPEGHYRWKVMEDDSLWVSGEVDVRAGDVAAVDVVLRPGVRRYVEFPVPVPSWGQPQRVDFVLRAPDGSVYDRGDFDPRTELPYRYMPPLGRGTWRLELQCDGGSRFAGAFSLSSMEPTREPIRVAVQPAR